MEVEQQASGVPAGWEVVAAPSAPEPSKGRDFKVLGVNIHVPGEEKPRLDSNMLGWGDKGAGIAPEDALMVGQAGRSIAKAASSGGALAGAKTALAEASPLIKYEVARSALHYAGLPDAIAVPLAIGISGYRKGAKEVPAEAPADLGRIVKKVDRPNGPLTVARPPGATYANPTGATPSAGPVEPVASGPVAPAPQAAPAVPEAVGPPIAESGSPRPVNSLPDQKALNEEALARRRAEYQAKVKAEAEAKGQPQPTEKAKLSAPESKEYMRMRQAGKTHPQAMGLIEAQRAFQLRFGTPTPTAAETRFPKGMRDYKTQP